MPGIETEQALVVQDIGMDKYDTEDTVMVMVSWVMDTMDDA